MISKRRKWALILLGLIAVVAVMTQLTRHREPHYHGRSLSYWLQVYSVEWGYEIAGQPRSHEGRNAIRTIGTNALPYLLEWMNYERPRSDYRTVIGGFLGKVPLVSRTQSVQEWVRHDAESRRAMLAIKAFSALGHLAEPALPELNRRMKINPRCSASDRAIIALGYIGDSAVPLLEAHLADTNAPNRRQVAYAFALFPALATNDTSVVTLLLAGLDDPHLERESCYALARVAACCRPHPELVVPALTKHLQASKDFDIRKPLAEALGDYGMHSRAAVPLLLKMAVNETAEDTNNDATSWGTEYPDALVSYAQLEAEELRGVASNALMKIAPEILTNAPPQ